MSSDFVYIFTSTCILVAKQLSPRFLNFTSQKSVSKVISTNFALNHVLCSFSKPRNLNKFRGVGCALDLHVLVVEIPGSWR